jgi:hypothetical protein
MGLRPRGAHHLASQPVEWSEVFALSNVFGFLLREPVAQQHHEPPAHHSARSTSTTSPRLTRDARRPTPSAYRASRKP